MKFFKKTAAHLLVFCLLMSAVIISNGSLKTSAAAVNGEYTLSYLSAGGWTYFDAVAYCTTITGIRIQSPSGKGYYLEYATQNSGISGFYSSVKSTDTGTDDYAGSSNSTRTIQRIKIKVFDNSGNSLDSKIIVMYRVKTAADGWLAWVSNATAAEMQSVQTKYSLDGTLDTKSGDAGISGKNITALEIRIFEEDTASSVTPTLDSCETSPSLYYSKDDLTKNPFSKSAEDQMDCLWIETNPARPYYLEYRVAASGGWYSYVSSLNTSDYAGVKGNRITKLNIRAKTKDGSSLTEGVVVMYRAKVNGSWLAWVSNADPEWMAAAQIKYQLTGILDYDSGYAGLSSGAVIEGVEIRVFEENNLNPEITPTGKSKIIGTSHIYQTDNYPTGCESVSAVMALNYFDIDISVDTFIDNYLEKGDRVSFDPNLCFGGDPRSTSGMGCYAPVIEKAVSAAIGNKKLKATAVYGKSVGELCELYIDNDIPVIFWATRDMLKPYKGADISYNGSTISWIAPEHCLLLVGYDDNNYIFHDPLKTETVTYYSKQSVITAYLGMGAQAAVIEVISPQKGDANFDGNVDILDIIRLKKRAAELTKLKSSYNADMNDDGEINGLDLTELRKALIEKV